VLAAVARGAVVMVASRDEEATHALSLGVDEVLRTGEMTPVDLKLAIQRARVRAGVRETRFTDDDGTAFSLLAAAVGHDLLGPLVAAASTHERLSNGFRPLLDVTDSLVSWAALVAPTEELRRLVAARAAAPSSSDLRAMLVDARESLRRSEGLLRLLREISCPGAEGDVVALSGLLEQIGDLMRGYVSTWAELHVETAGSCFASGSRPMFTCLVSSLVANAIESVRMANRRDGRICLRASEHEGAVLLEVEDNGRQIPVEIGSTLFEPMRDPRARAGEPSHALAGARERVLRAGGELLVDSDSSGTTVRVVLPIEAAKGVRAPLPDGWSHLRRAVSPRSS
jgi:two-component system, NtrC family, sensor kinase